MDHVTFEGTTTESAREDDNETLVAKYEDARDTYDTCGGHWLAARAKAAMEVLAAELTTRGIEV